MLFRKFQTFLVTNAEGRTGKHIFAFFNKHLFAGVHSPVQAEDNNSDETPLDDQLENFQQGIDAVDALDLDALTLNDNAGDATTSARPPAATATTIIAAATTTIAATATATSLASLDTEASQRQMESIPEEDEVELVEPKPRPRPKPTSKASTSKSRKQPTAATLVEENIAEDESPEVGVRSTQKRATRSSSSGSK